VWDAWGRLVRVEAAGGGTVLAGYGYDALSRRVTETHGGTTTDLYYSAAWQVLEERSGGAVQAQYVWSPVYVDALVLRDRDTVAGGGLEERLYALQDGNFNVTALVNPAGQVVERYAYDPYGRADVLDATWTVLPGGSAYGWEYRFQGLRRDLVVEYDYARFRVYSPVLMRFISTDPIGFGGGDANLFRFVGNGPTNYTDPSGLYEGTPWVFNPWQTFKLIVGWGGDVPAERARLEMVRQKQREIYDRWMREGNVIFPGGVDPWREAELAAWNALKGNHVGSPQEIKIPHSTSPPPPNWTLILWGPQTGETGIGWDILIGLLGGRASLRTACRAPRAEGVLTFRVQGGVPPNVSRARFFLNENGKLAIEGKDMLYINVNQRGRAMSFLARRGEGAKLVEFELKPEFVQKLRDTAVKQREGPRFPDRPQIVDPKQAPDQFGVPKNMFQELLDNVIPGSVKGL
jgi:RHS repeat-associated protein